MKKKIAIFLSVIIFVGALIFLIWSMTGSILIYKEGVNIIVKKSSITIYDNDDANMAMQTAMNVLLFGGDIFMHGGTYDLNHTLVLGKNIHLSGLGNSTTLDFSGIKKQTAIEMKSDSSLKDIKISGSINPLPKEFSQAIDTADNTRIDNIVISQMGYGIELKIPQT